MENSIKNKFPTWFLILTMAVSVAAELFPVFYLVLPAMFASLLIRSGRLALPLFAPSIVFLFVLPELTGSSDSVISLACFAALGILGGIAIWQCQKRKAGGFYSAMFAAGAAIAGIYGALCLPGILSGAGAFTLIQESFRETADFLKQSLEAISTPETQPVIDQYLSVFNAYTDSVPVLLVPIICIFGCIIGLSNSLFFYLFTRKTRESLGLTKLTPFRLWSIPQSCTIGLVILLLGTLVLRLIDSDSYAAVSSTTTTLLGFPLMVQGLSFIDFLIQRSKSNHTVKRVLIYVALGVFLALISSMLIMLGCFEQVFRIRARLLGARKDGGSSSPFGGDS